MEGEECEICSSSYAPRILRQRTHFREKLFNPIAQYSLLLYLILLI